MGQRRILAAKEEAGSVGADGIVEVPENVEGLVASRPGK